MDTIRKAGMQALAVHAALLWFLFGMASEGLAQEGPEFSEVRFLIEINATDGDAGFQGLIDGDHWKSVTIRDPYGRKLYTAKDFGSIRLQGLTENFFESAEPSCDELSLAEFLARFPAGVYEVNGRTADGETLHAEAVLTHDLPPAPINLSPTGGGIDALNTVKISWTPGADLGNCPPDGAVVGVPDIFGYRVVVEREEPEPPVVFTADLPASAVEVMIPQEFLQSDAIFKYEVIAIEARANDEDEVERGNQTISEDFFCTFVPTVEEPCELPD